MSSISTPKRSSLGLGAGGLGLGVVVAVAVVVGLLFFVLLVDI
jgi:hypothetical protein